jgi:transcriptional regulator with XRE-family HTH domain
MSRRSEPNAHMGDRIKAARRAAGLTQERFAELIDMGPKNLSDIECGAVGVSVGALKRMCQVLHVTSDSLLFDTREGNDVDALTDRLRTLPEEEFRVMRNIINDVFEAFAVKERQRNESCKGE